ncbi:MAG TPA: MarR family transcriptional regulator [Allosphingosinicella sp.]|nr:MarR family transcriptional regulator [Allosphingosinicella sp.]
MAPRDTIWQKIETRPTAGRTEVGFGALAEIIGLHISLANAAILQNFKKRFETLQLTPKQTSLLWLVSDNPGVSQVDFARLFGIDRATMLGITNTMTRRGYIERRPMANNARRLGLHLTDSGAAVLAEAKAQVAIHEEWVKRRFTPAELDTIISLMARLYEDDDA